MRLISHKKSFQYLFFHFSFYCVDLRKVGGINSCGNKGLYVDFRVF